MIRFIIKSLSVFLFVSAINAQQKDTLRLDLVGKDLPFGLTQKEPSSTPKIGIALSGGGARSISQLGLLRALEERNIPIEYIVGTSMGSIIGGLYSAGYSLDELDSVVINTRWDDLFSADQSDRNELFIDRKITEDRAILAFRMDGFKPIIPKSISSGQRGATFLNLLSLNAPIKFIKNYDNYKFKYRAISTDLISGKEIILDKGPLGLSMQASSSVTLLLPPVKKDSLLLVDGGLVANIPVKETRKLGAEIIIAGNTSSPLYTESELSYPWVIADQLVSIPMQILNEQQLEEADFIIQPKLEGRKNTDFSNIPELIRSGYTASLPVVDLVEKEFERKFKYNLNIKEKFYKGIIILEAPEKTKVSIQSKFTQQNFISNKELL